MKLILFCLLLVSISAFAASDTDRQIQELEAAIVQLQQEQQILFQQFQMLQELRRHEITQGDEALLPQGEVVIGGEIPKYEDMTKRRKERLDRIQRFTSDLDELYARYQDMENERRALIEQLSGLKLGTPTPVKE